MSCVSCALFIHKPMCKHYPLIHYYNAHKFIYLTVTLPSLPDNDQTLTVPELEIATTTSPVNKTK